MIITCCSCKTQIDLDLGAEKGWKREGIFTDKFLTLYAEPFDIKSIQKFNLKILCPECIIIKDIIE
jgi:hypothetical protein